MKSKIFSLFKIKMEYQILISVIAAFVVGVYFKEFGLKVDVLGNIYLSLLKFVIGPLLLFSIMSAIIGMGDLKSMGKLGGMTLGIYIVTTILAITGSLLFFNTFNPGLGVNLGEFPNFSPGEVQELSFTTFLLSLVPDNVIKPFLENNAMQIVIMAFIFGSAALVLTDKDKIKVTYDVVDTISEIVLKFTGWIIALTPIGVFGIIASLVAQNGLEPILSLWKFALVSLGALLFHMLVILPSLTFFLGKFNPYEYIWKMKEVVLFAFSTASSSATLPLNLVKSIEVGKVKKKVAEMVLPIGATVNMDGTALYQAGVALFVAQATGVDLSIMQQITIAFIVVLASVGAAGIPGAGIVMLTTVFASVGLPIEAIGAIMVIDRFLDMFRTAVNVSGDIYVTKIMDKKITDYK